jgi:hypothetical protein
MSKPQVRASMDTAQNQPQGLPQMQAAFNQKTTDTMKIKITLTEEMLGTASANPDIHREYIASKAPDASGIEEEVAAIGAAAALQKAITVFPKENGKPFLWDYQVKGFLKEAVGIMIELSPKEIKVGKTKLTKWTHKRIVDNFVFVYPRKIFFNGEMDAVCTRPLRADTMQGERVSLASSETIKAGATIQCEIELLVPSLDELIRSCLDYGHNKGLGQWRNSGKGRFVWEEIA